MSWQPLKMNHFQNPKQKQKLCQLKQITQSGKSGHRELDEMGRVFGEKGGGGIMERDGETCEPVSEGEKKGGQDKFGGKLVAQWGFLPEFSLSGWGRKGRREGREGEAGTSLGQQQYGVCVD